MKKFMILFFVIVMSIAMLAGCGEEGSSYETQEHTTQPESASVSSSNTGGVTVVVNGSTTPSSEPVEEEDTAEILNSGTCGSNVSWKLDVDGNLKISGNGPIKDYGYDRIYSVFSLHDQEWASYKEFIKNVVIEEGVTGIGSGAFYECSAMTSISIPDTVHSIGYAAFEKCSSLTEITLPENLSDIDQETFYHCSSLESVVLPTDGMSSIGYRAFAGCESLKEITIPSCVTSITDGAFYGCTSLREIHFEGNLPEWESSRSGSSSNPFGGGVVAIAYYPASNPTWIDELIPDYSGITWTPS